MVTFDDNPFQPSLGPFCLLSRPFFSLTLARQGKVKHHDAEPELIL